MTDPASDVDLETPENDAAEQAASAVPGWPDDERGEAVDLPRDIEAPDWDANEQNRIVTFDDDYDR